MWVCRDLNEHISSIESLTSVKYKDRSIFNMFLDVIHIVFVKNANADSSKHMLGITVITTIVQTLYILRHIDKMEDCNCFIIFTHLLHSVVTLIAHPAPQTRCFTITHNSLGIDSVSLSLQLKSSRSNSATQAYTYTAGQDLM